MRFRKTYSPFFEHGRFAVIVSEICGVSNFLKYGRVNTHILANFILIKNIIRTRAQKCTEPEIYAIQWTQTFLDFL